MEITIAEFKEQYFPLLQEQYHASLQRSITENRDQIITKLYQQAEGFLLFTNRFQKQIPIEIGEVQIALLQTSVHLHKPQIAFCAYDEAGILGREIFNIKYDAMWLFEGWEAYRESIREKVRELHAENYIREAAIQQMMWESMDFTIYCLYGITKYLFQEFFLMKGYDELLSTDHFRLSVGGYRDWSRTLYRKREKIDIFFKEEGEMLQYCRFENAVYNRKKFEKMDMSHTFFVDCEFVHSDFKEVIWRDAIFENCRFYHCKFEKVDFCGSTFRNVTMKKDTFKESVWEFQPDMEHPETIEDIYKPVEWEQCIKEELVFEEVDA